MELLNGLPFNRAYEMLFDNPFSQSNSLLQIVLGVKIATLIPVVLICGFTFFGHANGNWMMDNFVTPSYLYAGG